MVVMTMMTVMSCGGKRRSGKHQDQKHSSKYFFHGLNVA